MNRNKNRKAFTIVELIIVIVVIGVLAAILIPTFANIISKANAKSALSDARSTLTSFIADNIGIDGGVITDHIVIFVNKADKFYVYGWTNMENDTNRGNLMKADNNDDMGWDYATLEAFINVNVASPAQYQAGNQALAADPNATDPYAGKLFYLLPYVAPTPSILSKGNSNSTLDTTYNNLSSRISGNLPDNVDVFDGVLCGIVETTTENPQPPAPVQYTVTYNANGGVGTMTDNTQYTSGATVTVLANTFTRDGYHFTSWNTQADGNGTTIAGSFGITQNTTLFAQWEEDAAPSYSITVNFNDTWNGQDSYVQGSLTVDTLGNCNITKAMVQAFDPEFTINETSIVVNVTGSGDSVTFTGTRNRTIEGELYRVITTAAGIQKINDNGTVNDKNSFAANYIVNNDINLGGGNWVPICWQNGAFDIGTMLAFSGVFDGNNKTVSGLNMNYTTVDNNSNFVGFFAAIGGGTVKNLTVQIGSSIVGNERVGGIVGYLRSGSQIVNCKVTGTSDSFIEGITVYVGGIVGISTSNTVIEKCVCTVYSINGYNMVGGLVGENSSTIDQCITTSGLNAGASTYASTARLNGGLAGVNKGTIQNCIAQPAANIQANYRSGLFVGNCTGTIQYCYGLGEVVPQGTSETPVNNVNAAVGYKTSAGNIHDCYVVSDLTDAYVTVYNSTSSLAGMSSIPNWDTTIWNITGNALPRLRNTTV